MLATTALADCHLTLRWDDDPPFFIADGDSVSGIDADVSHEAMRRIGCTLSMVKMPWARALFELRNGRVDMLSSAYRTEEREQFALYSTVQGLISPNILFVRADERSNADVDDLRQLLDAGVRLGAQIRVSYGREFDTLSKDPVYRQQILLASRRELLWEMLARGRVDAVIADRLTGLHEIQELGLTRQIAPSQLVLSSKPAYFIFSRKTVSSDLVERFDQALTSMLEDGTYARIVHHYVCSTSLIEGVVHYDENGCYSDRTEHARFLQLGLSPQVP